MWQLQSYQPDLNRLLEQLPKNKDRKEDKTFAKYFSILPVTDFFQAQKKADLYLIKLLTEITFLYIVLSTDSTAFSQKPEEQVKKESKQVVSKKEINEYVGCIDNQLVKSINQPGKKKHKQFNNIQ